MKTKGVLLGLIFIIAIQVSGQVSVDSLQNEKKLILNGFIRAGFYGDLHNNSQDQFFSSGFSDFGLKIDSRLSGNLKAHSDLRFRYGSEFHQAVDRFSLREAYIDYSAGKFKISAGQKIIKWGRADFTNPTSKLNPQNYITRSPDREDMDMGNLLSSLSWSPGEKFTLQAVAIPFYRSSVLLIDPIPLPSNVSIEQMNSLVSDKKLFSYGIKADFHLSGVDFGTVWFDGYDPMPGISMNQFSADFSGPFPVITTGLKTIPYRTRMAGADFEASAGRVGIRGEAAWTAPSLSWRDHEYIPMQEIRWVAGAEITLGNWRLTGEYSGKFIPGFEPSAVDPIIGSEPDYARLAQLLATPGFDLQDYIRQQIGAFNRLYNYQLEKYYHQGGLRIESDLVYGKLLPSVFALYNFTSHDLMVIPELKIKPADGLTVVIGAEIWNGRTGSLYNIVKDYMSSVYAGIKIDF